MTGEDYLEGHNDVLLSWATLYSSNMPKWHWDRVFRKCACAAVQHFVASEVRATFCVLEVLSNLMVFNSPNWWLAMRNKFEVSTSERKRALVIYLLLKDISNRSLTLFAIHCFKGSPIIFEFQWLSFNITLLLLCFICEFS